MRVNTQYRFTTNHRVKFLGLLLVIVVLLMPALVSAQGSETPLKGETRSELQELNKFHKVIQRIWHSAWPRKDVQMLRDMLPEVEQSELELRRATLPGILRDRQSAWSLATDSLKSIVEEYQFAVAKGDSIHLLKTAERLHAQYEHMVRLIRPPWRELDQFHAVLYPLYHYAAPKKDLEWARKSVAQLVVEMQELDRAGVPARFNEKAVAIADAKDSLRTALNLLVEAAKGESWDEVERHIERVHEKYRQLSQIFD